MKFLLTLLLIVSGFFRPSLAVFTLFQYNSNSSSSGIGICVRLDYPPGKLFRNNIPTGHINLTDAECVFESGLEQSTQHVYSLEDKLDNVVSNIFCTHPAPPYAVVADLANETTVRVNHTRLPGLGVTFYTIGLVEEGHLREIATVQDEELLKWTNTIPDLPLFTSYTFYVHQIHICYHNGQDFTIQRSEDAFSNTIRTAPNDVGLAMEDRGPSFVTLSIRAQDFGLDLDYIMRRDGDIMQKFMHPEYFGEPQQWNDTGLKAATEYNYQIEAKDRSNGYSVFSNPVTACTNPPEVLSFDYSLNAFLKPTFTWNIPTAFYEKAIAGEITTDYLIPDTRSDLASPYSWPYTLDPTTAYHFHLRLYIVCDEHQYTEWTSLVVRANRPENNSRYS
ncbi:uncharacterized protein LOC142337017 [Convolutriloba macropyga]|uniref:uncharacterized protein LOC142337017 n=1 Tax=Convolutriloba macropyga TaxID=536237 RepID=UPI003F51B7B1